MIEENKTNIASEESDFSRQVGAQAARRLKARRLAPKSVWFGLGMSGLVGWSVTIPTLIGAVTGMWVDKHYPSTYSWTLMLLFAGLTIGCLNAWKWVDSEYKVMLEDSDE
jgi:ATP synthase protein I